MKYYLQKGVVLIFSLFFASSLLGQIHGTVKDAAGMALVGVTVKAIDENVGTVTDIDGNYSMIVSDKAVALEFSYIGYKTVKVNINARKVIDVNMEEDVKALNEVVVIGYGVE
ncbi:MAG TPA: carboxypeptidase-like regulatory domain-containing protein, partial [Saprospiraceae bacterium]|nr:carboxypeptidase-like regulatory domain-containing protein [Saprospiraceae bacterium]